MKNKSLAAVMALLILIMSLLSACSTSPMGHQQGEYVPSPEQLQPKTAITVQRSTFSGASCGYVKLYALDDLTTYSPDGRIKAELWQDEKGGIYYSVQSVKETVIEPSKLGLAITGGDFSFGIEEVTSYDRAEEIYQKYDTCLTISQEDVSCLDHCMEREVLLKKGKLSLTLMLRVYNDGFALRYKDVRTDTNADNIFVMGESTQVNLPNNTVTFAGGYSATYEFDYIERSYDELTNHNGVFNTPLTAYTGERWLLFSESDAYASDVSYCKSVLQTNGGSPALSWQFGFKRDPLNEVNDDLSSPGHIRIDGLKTQNGFTTPWRVTIIADDLNGLLNSSVIDSLCPAMDEKLFKSTDWIKPGKVSWSWWSGGDQSNYDVQVDHVDFSAENGWEYCCLDAGWPAFEDRIKELCSYAKKKGVGIILWVNYLKLKSPEEIERLFSQWENWGVVGVKTDYFESDAPEVLEVMRNCAEIGAKHKLMIYYHGCINPCGETRTYPNIMSSEAVLGEEFRKWSTSPEPRNCLMYPFTRNITGSMDYTPSCIAIAKTGETAGFSLAKAIVYESALQHFASSAYSFPYYLGLPLLNRIPTAWAELRVLSGYPGEHITVARRSGDDWYIGAMSLESRKVDINLYFLGDGIYNAYIYYDKDGSLALEERTITAADSLKLDLPDIGGAAVMITKDTVDTEVSEAAGGNLEGYSYYECEDGKLRGEARVSDGNMCSGGKKVGYIGNGAFNSVELTVKAEAAGEYDLVIYCCSGEKRRLDIWVGSEKYTLEGVSSPGFDIPAAVNVTVKLDKGDNVIRLSSEAGYAPDVDRIAIGAIE